MAYYTGDIPAHPLVIEPPFDLDEGCTATARILNPTGAEVATPAAACDAQQRQITVTITSPSPWDEPGIYRLILVVMFPAGAQQRVPAVPLVIQGDTEIGTWNTLDSARGWDGWPDALHIDDHSLYRLLDVARGEVIAYAPALPEDAPIPENYRMAQLMQARNRWNAARVDPSGGDADNTSFALTPFPLDWDIKQVLRPKSARPVIG